MAKADSKVAVGVDTSHFAIKSDLASLKAAVDKIDVDQQKTVPDDLSKLRNVVDNDVVKKTVHEKVDTKLNAIDAKVPNTTGLVSKTQCSSLKRNFEKKKIEDVNENIPNTSGLVKKTDYNAQITEIENKILDITNLAIKATRNTKATEI